MKQEYYLLILISLLSPLSGGTTFIPLPIEKQVNDSYGVIQAIYKGKNYKKLSDETIITEATFKILKSSGLRHKEIVNKNNFKVIYPGGIWQNLIHKVHGTPEFHKGEEVVLILQKTPIGLTIKGLSVGKYTVHRTPTEEYIKSSVFLNHPKLGKIDLKKIDKITKERFGTKLESIKIDTYVHIPSEDFKQGMKERKGRAPASIISMDDHQETSPIIWPALIFIFLGAYKFYSMKTKRK